MVGGTNVLLLNSCPIGDYGVEQLGYAQNILASKEYYKAYKILKKARKFPGLDMDEIRKIESLLLSKLNSEKTLKKHSDKLKIKFLGKIRY